MAKAETRVCFERLRRETSIQAVPALTKPSHTLASVNLHSEFTWADARLHFIISSLHYTLQMFSIHTLFFLNAAHEVHSQTVGSC